jgi:DNA repair protein RecN (Recombination protein N)
VAGEAGGLAGELSAARQRAARQLAARVQQELASLNMGGATFLVRVSRQPDVRGLRVEPESELLPAAAAGRSPGTTVKGRARAEGGSDEPETFAFDQTGIDQVEFLVAPNVGESPKPVARIASGGETSRIMLALKSALSEADQTATLVFDEVDVGVGGRSGRVIGEKLWQLARHHQVLCITHLPQVAVYGGDHQKIRKVVAGGRTSTAVESLSAEERVEEVAQMFGGTTVTATTRRAAQDLLAQAEEWKHQATGD